MPRFVRTLALLAALAPLPALAAPSDYHVKLFGAAAYVSPLSENTLSGVADSVKASSEVGWEVGAELKPFRRFGFEISYLDSEHDIDSSAGTLGTVRLRPWSLTLDCHVIDGKHVNWYLGPTVSYVEWGDIETPTTARVPTSSDTAYGLATGLDIGLAQHFAIVAGLRWLNTSIDSAEGNIDVNPLFARLGVAFRF